MKSSGPLCDELHELFETGGRDDRRPSVLAAPSAGARCAPQLIVTTTYDLALERALHDAGGALDVVSYLAAGPNCGKFCHIGADGTATPIELPNTYAAELSLERRTIILRLHRQVDPTPERRWESFVVTEDDYIDYLPRSEVAKVVPVGSVARLQRSDLLFFGYSMADRNLRLLLHRLRVDQPALLPLLGVQPDPTPLEREFLRRRQVDVVELEASSDTSSP